MQNPPGTPQLIPLPDVWHVNAAEGWIGLGSPREAARELERVALEVWNHPRVMRILWEIYARVGEWEQALKTASHFCTTYPGNLDGWLLKARSLRALKNARGAYKLLLEIGKESRGEWLLLYELATYACAVGEIEEARTFLHGAFAVGDKKEIMKIAVQDRRLDSVWEK